MAEASQALATTQQNTNPIFAYVGERALRQIALIVGLALAIAGGIGLYMWARQPVMRPLYSQLDDQDAKQVMDALQASGIQYKLNDANGAIMVPAEQVRKARLQLASQGLPHGSGVGFEMLQKDQGFGTSQFVENARFQRALETELARTISTIDTVKSARVHLAIPKQSVFLRDDNKPSASVLVDLYPGRNLSDGQVAAIEHLVAGSVPDLNRERVTVVDQEGDLLSSDDSGKGVGRSQDQFEYRQRVEQNYAKRIEELLTPIVGRGKVKAQVSADLNFARKETTQEAYDDKGKALVSEQINRQQSTSDNGAQGVPGALSNQPPGAGTTQPPANNANANTNAGAGNGNNAANGKATKTTPGNSSSNEVRNYQVGKTITHTVGSTGAVQRLSIAVLLDQKETVGPKGKKTTQPFSPQEIAQITDLVKQTVGFDAQRGDQINVMNAAFQPAVTPPPPPKTPLLQQPWVWQIGKAVIAGIIGLILIFTVVRPIVQALLGRGAWATAERREQESLPEGEEQRRLAGPGDEGEERSQGQIPQLSHQQQQQAQDDKLQAARDVVGKEPALAANVVKNWLSEDE